MDVFFIEKILREGKDSVFLRGREIGKIEAEASWLGGGWLAHLDCYFDDGK
jgi:hypothetical protein